MNRYRLIIYIDIIMPGCRAPLPLNKNGRLLSSGGMKIQGQRWKVLGERGHSRESGAALA